MRLSILQQGVLIAVIVSLILIDWFHLIHGRDVKKKKNKETNEEEGNKEDATNNNNEQEGK